MPKAKLSQIAATWVDEEHNPKKKEAVREKTVKKAVKNPPGPARKKKQTFNLKAETLQRLWAERVRSGRTISRVVDDLVNKYLPEVKEF